MFAAGPDWPCSSSISSSGWAPELLLLQSRDGPGANRCSVPQAAVRTEPARDRVKARARLIDGMGGVGQSGYRECRGCRVKIWVQQESKWSETALLDMPSICP